MFNLFKRKKNREIILKAPFDGEIIGLDQVPDQVFSNKMVGDGIAIKPENDYLVAPVGGKVIQLFPTHHALGIRTEGGLELLIHLGIDSVELKGRGFTALINEGDRINEGEGLIKINWSLIKGEIRSTISPIVITNMENVENMDLLNEGHIKSGEDLISISIKR